MTNGFVQIGCRWQLTEIEAQIHGDGVITCNACGQKKLKGIQCQLYQYIPEIKL